jgi:hypothetical protein
MSRKKLLILALLTVLEVTQQAYARDILPQKSFAKQYATSHYDSTKEDILAEITQIVAASKETTLSDHDVKILTSVLQYENLLHFCNEPDAITALKRELLKIANKKNYIIPLSPSDAMLMTYDSNMKRYIKENIITIPNLSPLLERLAAQENDRINSHNYVFYHALKKDIYMQMYIHTKILELISPISPSFLMLRCPGDSYAPLYLPSILRTYFVYKGSKQGDWQSRDRYHLLSTNHTIFGNLHNHKNSKALLSIARQEFFCRFRLPIRLQKKCAIFQNLAATKQRLKAFFLGIIIMILHA